MLEYLRSATGKPLPEPRYDRRPGELRIEEFQDLWEEFLEKYFHTEKGRWHLEQYSEGRVEGRRNYDSILMKATNGEDVTDLVLLKLLPHMNSKGNRERGAWIFVAPAVTKDLKSWFEGAGWTKPADWPRVASAILDLVRRSVIDDESFKGACKEFSSREYSKGFQAGMLSPILSAVAPERFLILNSKSRRTLNRFAGSGYSAQLTDYPALNEVGHRFLADIEPLLESIDLGNAMRSDVFDQFSHWYVAIKKGFKNKPPMTAGEVEDEMEGAVEATAEEGTERSDDMPYFSEEAFDLLQGLIRTPTKDYYHRHRGEFEDKVIGPFKKLFRKVTSALPEHVKDRLETERRLFGMIPKNDYGQGGAWPYYWAALYPKGGLRTRDAQLYLCINGERVEMGFSFGDYDEESSERLRRALRSLQGDSRRDLEKQVLSERFQLGEREALRRGDSFGQLEDYLDFAEKEGSFTIRQILPRAEVIGMPPATLENVVVDAFTTLFPVFELASKMAPELEQGVGVAEPTAGSSTSGGHAPRWTVALEKAPSVQPPYTIDDLMGETGFARDDVQGWLRILRRKQQIVLQGPPGTGKTYLALKLARLLVGGTRGILDTVQFHPAYAYEDFMQGLRPAPANVGLQFRLEEGRFLQFCAEARRAGPDPAVLIIDEINRANLATVFGELMLLLEYRDKEIPLAAGGEPFRIPDNVFIIGTMNTADRSIARMDHALRRRFSFIRLRPDYDVLKRHLEGNGHGAESLLKVLRDVNELIDDPNYEVGISYFLRREGDLGSHLPDIWTCEIEPYLEEYFYDQPEKVSAFRWKELVRDRLKDWV